MDYTALDQLFFNVWVCVCVCLSNTYRFISYHLRDITYLRTYFSITAAAVLYPSHQNYLSVSSEYQTTRDCEPPEIGQVEDIVAK